jgi:acetyl-CoA carboxylase biotin carboxyl carrier protein
VSSSRTDDPGSLSPGDIEEIVRIFAESDLEELRIDVGDTRLYLSKSSALGNPDGSPAAPDVRAPTAPAPRSGDVPAPVSDGPGHEPEPAPAQSPAPATDDQAAAAADTALEIRSPLLGVFYRRPSPNDAPFVELGSVVEPEDPVCIIDVMKMFTRVAAGQKGRIIEILPVDGQLVEHGQVLMRLEPA